MKTKQLGIFAGVAALVLMISFSSSTVFTKDGKSSKGGGQDRQVVILDCASGGPGGSTVAAVESSDPSSPELAEGMAGPLLSGTPCTEAVAFLLNNKFKIEGTHSGSAFLAGLGFIRSYTMVKK